MQLLCMPAYSMHMQRLKGWNLNDVHMLKHAVQVMQPLLVTSIPSVAYNPVPYTDQQVQNV